MKFGSVLMTLILLITSMPLSAVGWQDDPVVIRGPVEAEQADLRRGEDLYGPITRAETLWNIAHRVRPHSSVTIPQVMSAIVQANPHAFLDNNPNAMETGFILRIPSLQEIQLVNPQAAQRHIELGEQLEQSARRLQTSQSATEEADTQRVALLSRTREEAQDTLQQVRSEYVDEFAELRERLRLSIENTERVVATNQELRQQIGSLSEALDEIQRTMVAESEFQSQVRELMNEQQSMRLEQQAAREVEQEQGFANRIMASPLALLLLAFVPALILIVIATLVLRRRDHRPGVTNPIDEERGTGEVSATAMTESQVAQDDFELDETIAEFGDLDADEDGDDLSALEDEMLVPDEDEDDSIQLDEGLDDLDLSEFDDLDADTLDDNGLDTDVLGTDSRDTEGKQQPGGSGEPDDITEADEQALSQSALDELFAGGFDDNEGLDDITGSGLTDADKEPTDAEPSPGELFAGDENSEDDAEFESEQLLAESGESIDDEFDVHDEDEDADFAKMMEQFADDDSDDSLDDDDIETLLAKSDALINASETTQAQDDVNSAVLDEDDEMTGDTDEALSLDAEETLDFTSQDESETIEDESATTSVKAPPASDAPTEAESASSFIDIDDIIDDAQAEPVEEDEPQSNESRRADEEDKLAAQLDLARAYLEMDEEEDARETIQSVLTQAQGDLLTEAQELLARLNA